MGELTTVGLAFTVSLPGLILALHIAGNPRIPPGTRRLLWMSLALAVLPWLLTGALVLAGQLPVYDVGKPLVLLLLLAPAMLIIAIILALAALIPARRTVASRWGMAVLAIDAIYLALAVWVVSSLRM